MSKRLQMEKRCRNNVRRNYRDTQEIEAKWLRKQENDIGTDIKSKTGEQRRAVLELHA